MPDLVTRMSYANMAKMPYLVVAVGLVDYYNLPLHWLTGLLFPEV